MAELTSLDGLVPVIAGMAERLGKDVKVTVKTGTYDRVRGVTVFTEEVFEPIKLLGLAPVNRMYLDLGLAEDGDCTALFAKQDLPFEVDFGLRVEFDDETWTVTRFEDIHTGQLIGAIKMILRRA